MHSNITPATRPQWLLLEDRLRDCLRRLDVQLQHSLASGCDFAVDEFLDDTTGELLQIHYLFSLETLARMLADDGVGIPPMAE